jgi:hypothetical protein
MSGPAFEDDGLSSEDEEDEEENYVDADDMLGATGASDIPDVQLNPLDLEGYTPQFEFSELKLSPLLITGDLPSTSTSSVPSRTSSKTRTNLGSNFVTAQEPSVETQMLQPPPSPITAEKKEKKSSLSALAKGIRRPLTSPLSLGLTPGSNGTKTPLSESGSGTVTPPLKPSSTTMSAGTSTGVRKKSRPKFKRSKASEYNFATNSDVLGIVLLEIVGAENLPRLKNSELFLLDPF